MNQRKEVVKVIETAIKVKNFVVIKWLWSIWQSDEDDLF